MTRNTKLAALIASGSVLAAGSGSLAAVALTAGQAQAPQITTTISVAGPGEQGPVGPVGPPGPQGPVGPSGAESCPTNSTFGELVINHPGGQVTILTCIKN